MTEISSPRQNSPEARRGLTPTAVSRLNLAGQILAVGLLAAIIYHYVLTTFVTAVFSSFLHDPRNIFCDFYSPFSTYVAQGFSGQQNYLPGAMLLYGYLDWFALGNPYSAVEQYLCFCVVCYLGLFWLLLDGQPTLARGFLSLLLGFCSYPVIFALHTANFESICFLCVGFAVVLHRRGRFVAAGVLLGFAASMKGYPLLFLAPLLFRSRWRTVAALLLSLLVFCCLPFLLTAAPVGNARAWLAGFRKGTDFYVNFMVYGKVGTHFGHSIVNTLQVLFPTFTIQRVLPLYFASIALPVLFLAGLALFARALSVRLLAVCLIICLFPLTSQDYKLQYFLLPLLFNAREPQPTGRDRVIYWLIIATLLYKGYWFSGNVYWANSNVYLTTLVMTATALFLIGEQPTAFRECARCLDRLRRNPKALLDLAALSSTS